MLLLRVLNLTIRNTYLLSKTHKKSKDTVLLLFPKKTRNSFQWPRVLYSPMQVGLLYKRALLIDWHAVHSMMLRAFTLSKRTLTFLSIGLYTVYMYASYTCMYHICMCYTRIIYMCIPFSISIDTYMVFSVFHFSVSPSFFREGARTHSLSLIRDIPVSFDRSLSVYTMIGLSLSFYLSLSLCMCVGTFIHTYIHARIYTYIRTYALSHKSETSRLPFTPSSFWVCIWMICVCICT